MYRAPRNIGRIELPADTIRGSGCRADAERIGDSVQKSFWRWPVNEGPKSRGGGGLAIGAMAASVCNAKRCSESFETALTQYIDSGKLGRSSPKIS